MVKVNHRKLKGPLKIADLSSPTNHDRSPLQFQRLPRLGDAPKDVEIYRAWSNACLFARLYVNRENYSVVWRGSGPDFFQPCAVVKIQFTDLPLEEIRLMDPVLPETKRSDTAGLFRWETAKVFVIFKSSGMSHEYDLQDQTSREQYLAEVVNSPNGALNLQFARYDFGVRSNAQQYQTSFSIEGRGPELLEWEFSLRVQRSVQLKERTLKWIAKNHLEKRSLTRTIDFDGSRAALYKELREK